VVLAATGSDDQLRRDQQLSQEIERLDRPSRHELEPITIAAVLQLDVDRARFAIERETIGAGPGSRRGTESRASS
jgi:hypothetical protein